MFSDNCPQLQLWLRGNDMPSLIFDKVGLSLVHYESCVMGIGIPSEPQLSDTLQMEFFGCNDIGTSEHDLSTKLE
jgi:hypothetical protein